MNKTLLIAAVVVVLALLAGGIYFATRPAAPTDDPGNPFDGLSSGTATGTPSAMFAISGTNDESFEVPDFRTGRTPLPGAGGNYYDLVHGDGPIFGDEGDRFYIQYEESTSAFVISVISEPLGESRLLAEEFLRTTLKLPNDQLCRLNVNVGVPGDVNVIYSSYANLGLSFCPGAIPLP